MAPGKLFIHHPQNPAFLRATAIHQCLINMSSFLSSIVSLFREPTNSYFKIALSDDEISNNGAVSDTEERLEVVEPDKASGTSKRQLASRAVPRMIASEDEENGEEVDEELNDEIDEDE